MKYCLELVNQTAIFKTFHNIQNFKNMNNEITIEQLKELLRENMDKGTICPCCNNYVKMYKRKLTSSMVFCLIHFKKHVDKNGNEFQNFITILDRLKLTSTQRADWQKLVYFKLITAETSERGHPRSGYYKLTELGIKFVNHQSVVPEFVKVYNSKTYGYSEKQINISQAINNKFNYLELMGK